MSKTKLLSLIAFCLVLTLAIFAKADSKTADVKLYNINEVTEEAVQRDNEKLYFSKKALKKMKKICISEMVSLYCDETTGSIAVFDAASKKVWRSLPEIYAGVKAGTVTLEVISDGAVYTLCSEADSTVKTEKGENFVKFIYDFEKSLYDKNKVKISLPVVFALKNGTLSAEADCSEIINESKNIILKGVSLLPFLGADREEAKGDYLLLPDGSGLAVDLSENPKAFEPLLIPVYGGDASKGEAENKKAPVGAFGMKKGSSAFAGIIEEGAELAELKAEKALSETGLNTVGAYFEITPSAVTEKGKLAVSKNSYNGRLRVSYRFLSSQNADYVGMASAVREVLIRNGSLPMAAKKTEGDYPFNLSVIGVGYDENAGQTKILTSYSQTYDILSSLKAKGITGIKLRYRGLFDGGINQRDISSAELALGDNDELSELTSYAKAQNISIFAEVKLITASEKDSFSNKAVSLSGGNTVKKPEKFEANESTFVSPQKTDSINEKLLVKMRDTDFDGIALADAGKYLYSDFGRNGSLPTETAEYIKNGLSSVSANKKLMVDTGNLYSVKFASDVINLPSVSYYKNRDLCSTVPFIQAFYHGFFDYSLTPINTANVSETMFLRSVEYGAVPHFEWYYTDNSTDESKDKYNYSNSINEAQLYYQRMSSALSDLRNARITAHEKVKSNVYMTEYEGSTKVYVNYRKTAVTVDGVTIEPRSFVRVG